MSDVGFHFTADAADAGSRLDVFLSNRLDLSRSQGRRLLAQGKVRVGDRTAGESDKGLLLGAGDVIAVEPFERREDERAVAQPELPLDVLAEGDGWIAVDKPSGMPVHPLESGERGTLLNAVIARYPGVHGVGESGLRSGVVHRLDVETSGVILLATTGPKWEKLREAFASHRTRKMYRAIVLGTVAERGALQLHLAVTRHKPAKVSVVTSQEKDARLCDLAWRPREMLNGATLVEVQLGTGFLHQVRVMLAHAGHPIAGDELYRPENFTDRTGSQRVMLHASSVRAGDAAAASADPPDFIDCLQRLGRTP